MNREANLPRHRPMPRAAALFLLVSATGTAVQHSICQRTETLARWRPPSSPRNRKQRRRVDDELLFPVTENT